MAFRSRPGCCAARPLWFADSGARSGYNGGVYYYNDGWNVFITGSAVRTGVVASRNCVDVDTDLANNYVFCTAFQLSLGYGGGLVRWTTPSGPRTQILSSPSPLPPGVISLEDSVIAVDRVNANVYFTALPTGSGPNDYVYRCDYNGGSPTALVSASGTHFGLISGLAVDPVNGVIFWSEQTDNGHLLRTANLSGGSPSTLFSAGLGASYIWQVDCDPAAQLVFFNQATYLSGTFTTTAVGDFYVKSIPYGGGTPTTLWSATNVTYNGAATGGDSELSDNSDIMTGIVADPVAQRVASTGGFGTIAVDYAGTQYGTTQSSLFSNGLAIPQ